MTGPTGALCADDVKTQTATRPCPLCGNDAPRLLRRTADDGRGAAWSLVRCAQCGMVYLRERLDYRTQAAAYDWEATFRLESSRRDRRLPLSRALGRAMALCKRLCGRENGGKMMAVVRRYERGGRLCDFGCGDGMLLAQAARHFSVVGIDISPSLAALARRRVPAAQVVVAPVTGTELDASSLDVVTMQSYLEHEQHPLAALRAAHRALRDRGIVVLKVPNYGSLNRRLRGGRWCGFRFPDHCNYFTRRTLRAAVQKAGFQVLAGAWGDALWTSDNMYLAARKAANAHTTPQAAPVRRAG